MNAKLHCIQKLNELRFLCLGDDNLVALISKLTAEIAVHDFSAHEELTRRTRLAYLNEGGDTQKTVTVELMDAAPFIGRFYYYRPGKALFFTPDGIREVSPMELTEDMHGCFQNDPTVSFAMGVKKIIAALEKHMEESEETAKRYSAAMDELFKGIETLKDKHTALQTENEELKTRLRELGE